jgi:diadenosine tetraphosphate (Ap4A) HIT family hydrolase
MIYKGLLMHMLIYEDNEIYIEKHDSEIPWLKIFTKEPYKELGDVPKDLRTRLWNVYDIIEYEMKHYYNPTKINMASFANMLPRVHIHVMARFEEDSYFPNPMWGEKLRDGNVELPPAKDFYKRVFNALQSV